MPGLHVNDLPDLCLIAILNRLSIQELFCCGLVCRRWQNIMKATCLKKLSLRIDNRDSWSVFANDEIDFYDIDIEYDLTVLFNKRDKRPAPTHLVNKYDLFISDINSGRFVDTFPNIKTLVVVNHSLEFDITTWLYYWSGVTSLTLIGSYNIAEVAVPIDQLKNLQYLTIDKSLEELSELLDMSRLEGFCCRFYRKHRTVDDQRMEAMCNILNQQHSVQKIGLWVEDHNGRFDLMAVSVRKALARLTVKLDSLEQLEWICSSMSQLRYLDLEFVHKANRSPFHRIIGALACCKKLVALKLNVHLDDYEMEYFSPEQYTERQNTSGALAQLHSLKRIEVKFPLNPHQMAMLTNVFPNLEIMSQRLIIFDYGQVFETLCEACENCNIVRRELVRCSQQHLDSVLFTYKAGKVEKTQLYYEYLDYL